MICHTTRATLPSSYPCCKLLCGCTSRPTPSRRLATVFCPPLCTAKVFTVVADPISRNPALHALQAHIGRCSYCSPALYALQLHDSDGDVNMNADADMDIYDSLNVSSQCLHNVRSGYSADPWFADDANTKDFTYVGEYWRRGELIIVPDTGDLRTMCMSLHHDTPYAAHLGRDRTKRLIMQTCWWPTIDSDVRQFVYSVKETSPPMQSLLVCCSHYLYLRFPGKACQWIPLLNFKKLN